jgi:hypothetical protein
MTKPDFTDPDHQQSDSAVMLKRALIGIGGDFALIFLVSIIAGCAAAVMREPHHDVAADAAVFALLLAVTCAVAYAIGRFWPRAANEPDAPRVKSARLWLGVSLAVSMPLGIMLAIADKDAPSLFSNGPLAPGFAAASLAVWLIVMAVLTWLWWRRVDEHEAGAYREGGFIAANAYMFIAPAWWLASRAGWLPAQDPMVVLVVVCAIWLAVWLAKKICLIPMSHDYPQCPLL